MGAKENIRAFFTHDSKKIRKEIYFSIIKSAEDYHKALDDGKVLAILRNGSKLLFYNTEWVFDDLTSAEALMAMKIGFHRAKSKSNKSR